MRKNKSKKRIHLPDPKYNDVLVTRFINAMMWGGKKSVASKVFYDALDKAGEVAKEDGYEIWKKAISNVMPSVEVKARRIGGATFQIPSEVRPARKIALTLRWIIGYSRQRSGRSMSDKLSAELVAASKNEGAAVKKKDDTHKMAEANKAFSHFRV